MAHESMERERASNVRGQASRDPGAASTSPNQVAIRQQVDEERARRVKEDGDLQRGSAAGVYR